MGNLVKRLASIFLAVGGWLVAGVRTTLDLVGWSTAPEDMGVAMTRLDHFLLWLLSLPWWVPWGFALVSTLWLTWVSWPRQSLATTNSDKSQDDRPAPTQEIFNRHFRNELVKLDGNIFIQCIFENTTLAWEGGRYSMQQCTMRENQEILTGNPVIQGALELFINMGALRADKFEKTLYPRDALGESGALVRPITQPSLVLERQKNSVESDGTKPDVSNKNP